MKNCPTCKQVYDDVQSFCTRDGEVLHEIGDDLVGRVLDGKYEVEEFIAQGGMGAVYLARHILLGDRVVIKTLRAEMRGNAEWLRRFQREGRAARSFRHPNVVTVYDLSAAAEGGLVYMVMEYVEGHTLDEELRRRGPFSAGEALQVLGPVGDALDAAHARGVVHRDLKPENIMLGRGEGAGRMVKVLDLGIAKLLGADALGSDATTLTYAGQVIGTPFYMSPEQWGEAPRNGGPEIDGRADVYSLGVIAFEMVTGHRPFAQRTNAELRRAHVSTAPPSVHGFAPEVPEAFGRAVARAMAKERDDRPATAGEFVKELRAALGQNAATGQAPTIAFIPGAQDSELGVMRPPETAASHRGPGDQTAETVFEGLPGFVPDEAATSPRLRENLTGPQASSATSDSVTPTQMIGGSTPHDDEGETLTSIKAERVGRIEHVGGPRVETGAQRSVEPHARVQRSVAPEAVVQKRVESKGHGKSLVLGAAAVAVLLVLGLGAWLAWSRLGAGGGESGGANENATPAPVKKVEALTYWVEAFGVSGTDAPKRMAEQSLTLASGEYFQLHFVPRERGYLYVIGPWGDGNAPTLFLGAQGDGRRKTNQLSAGSDFTFPYGQNASLRLDRNPGAEDYTVIFSTIPLTEPAALTKEVPYGIKPDELKAIEELRARQRSAPPALNADGESSDRRVHVLVPEAREDSQPVIFDIRIEHK